MKRSLSGARRRRLSAVAGAAVFLVALSACTGDQTEAEKDYVAPQSACGAPINAKALSGFLPSGKKVTVEATSQTGAASKCAISVDGKLVVQTSWEWWNDMATFEFARGMTLDDPDKRTDDGRYLYSGYQAFGKATECEGGQRKDQVLFTAIQAVGTRHRDDTAMKQLIIDYTQAVEKSPMCR
ncbi:hypothetical protein [Streptomyces longwoodensis]|nr:hypothetical protein [Streptomyces longwoodensis]